jgi:hypothetical protein
LRRAKEPITFTYLRWRFVLKHATNGEDFSRESPDAKSVIDLVSTALKHTIKLRRSSSRLNRDCLDWLLVMEKAEASMYAVYQ